MQKLVMKSLAPIAIIAASLLSTSAMAAPITGTITVSGTDTFNSSSITFQPTSGNITQASGSYSEFAPFSAGSITFSYLANLTSFSFVGSNGVQLYSATDSTGQTASFTISSLTSTFMNIGTVSTLRLTGLGNAFLTGFDKTPSTFSLTSSQNGGIGTFQFTIGAVPAAVPETTSWIMMIAGIGAIGFAMRRRQMVRVLNV